MFNFISPEHIAVMIPVIAMFGAVIIVIVAIIIGGKNKELEHKERVLSLEKGIPFPSQQNMMGSHRNITDRPSYSRRRATGLILIGLGLGLTISIWVAAGAVGGVYGLVPLFIGLGLLIAAALDKKEYEEMRDRKPTE
jgi:hypothetical protein